MKRLGGEDKRVKCLLNKSPKAKLAPGKEKVNSRLNPAAVLARPGRVNRVQKNTILDRRLNIEAFLVSLSEDHEVNCLLVKSLSFKFWRKNNC